MSKKFCRQCGRPKSYGFCKSCDPVRYEESRAVVKARSKRRRKEKPEEVAAYMKGWNIKNKATISPRRSAYKKANRDMDNQHSKDYRDRKRKATPLWAESEKHLIDKVYTEAKKRGCHVDHIVPFKSPLVCGLHCWHNLQILPHDLNGEKGNLHWPDMP